MLVRVGHPRSALGWRIDIELEDKLQITDQFIVQIIMYSDDTDRIRKGHLCSPLCVQYPLLQAELKNTPVPSEMLQDVVVLVIAQPGPACFF